MWLGLQRQEPVGILPVSLGDATLPKKPLTEVLPGTLDMLILKAVSLQPLHGYGVLQPSTRYRERLSRFPRALFTPLCTALNTKT